MIVYFKVPSDINGVIDKIAATTTKIFYVPIGGNICNDVSINRFLT